MFASPSLWLYCPHASSEDLSRGVAAARAVFLAAGLTAAHCQAQSAAQAEGDDYGIRGHATWCEAEAAAVAACCAGWHRVPESAYLALDC
jgi:hypothetical protein